MNFKLRKGLDLPLAGAPEQIIESGQAIRSVALLGRDYPGIKPSIAVSEGATVRLGQPLFSDKANPDVIFAAPGSGRIRAIHRGPRRVLQSIIIDLHGDEAPAFDPIPPQKLAALGRDFVKSRLLESGLWTALRTRPFSKVPKPDDVPAAIFVNAMDTNPLAASPQTVVGPRRDDFLNGLNALANLTDGPLHVCTSPDSHIPVPDNDQCLRSEFAGPHPAGLVGTHIHFLYPVSAQRKIWHLDYQDVLAIGRLFVHGRLCTERVVALAGPMVKRPRLVRTRLGASTQDLVANELTDGPARVISGSVLSGHRTTEWGAYLGRYHRQVSVLAEGGEREFFGWLRPGSDKYSATRAYAGHLLRSRFGLTTLQNGSPRAMVPIGNFERVMPLDILPAPLLKALLVGDTETAQALGCLELDEEDLALCSFVCSGKYEYGQYLRETLTEIERHG